jgi:hypothetical protein
MTVWHADAFPQQLLVGAPPRPSRAAVLARVDELNQRWLTATDREAVLPDALALVMDQRVDPRYRVRLRLQVAGWEYALNRRDASVATAFECRRQALELGDLKVAAWATLQMCQSAVFSGADRDELIAAIDEAAQMFDRLGLATGSALAHVVAGIAFEFTMNDPRRALARLALARERRGALPAEYLAYVLGFQSIAFTRLGMLDQAMAALRDGVALRRDQPESGEDGLLRLGAASAALAQRSPVVAIEHLTIAVGIAERQAFGDLHVEVLRILAHTHEQVRDQAAARAAVSQWRAVKARCNAGSFTDAWWQVATLGQWNRRHRQVSV